MAPARKDAETVATPTKADESTESQVGRNAALMSFLVIVSRITGFFRTWGQSFALGAGMVASCYSVANNLPNQLYEIVVGGMLVTAFLPVYMSVKRHEGEEGASRYTSNLVSIVILLMGAVTILGFVFAAQLVWTQSFSATSEFDAGFATYLFRFFVVEVVLYSLSSIFSGVLNAERDYFWSSASSIFNNFVVTASFLLYAALVGSNPSLATVILAIGNPLGVAVQVVCQMPSLRKHGIHLTWHVDWHDPHLKETLSIGVPSLVVMITSFVQTSVQQSTALSVTVSGASVAYYARLWYTLPYAIPYRAYHHGHVHGAIGQLCKER
jgi:putative peptidoglycan lipid II flippase